MIYRAAAINAAILAALGATVAVPVATETGPVASAQAVDDNQPADDSNDENSNDENSSEENDSDDGDDGDDGDGGGTTAPPPAGPLVPDLPPQPADTLEDGSPPAPVDNTGGRPGVGGEHNVSHPRPTRPAVLPSHRQPVLRQATSIRPVSDTGPVPQGGVQAGGGGMARSVSDTGPSDGALGPAAGLVLLVTGSGLVLRRRRLEANN
jgi:LPXTG-motif cell wall-anchored protein